MKEAQTKKNIHVYKILKNANYFYGDRKQISGHLEWNKGQRITKECKDILGGDEYVSMYITLVMIGFACIYIDKIH